MSALAVALRGVLLLLVPHTADWLAWWGLQTARDVVHFVEIRKG